MVLVRLTHLDELRRRCANAHAAAAAVLTMWPPRGAVSSIQLFGSTSCLSLALRLAVGGYPCEYPEPKEGMFSAPPTGVAKQLNAPGAQLARVKGGPSGGFGDAGRDYSARDAGHNKANHSNPEGQG